MVRNGRAIERLDMEFRWSDLCELKSFVVEPLTPVLDRSYIESTKIKITALDMLSRTHITSEERRRWEPKRIC